MTSVYSPRWTAPEPPQQRRCDVPGCDKEGGYRAPRSRFSEKNKDYHHFCLSHVQEYNKSWNYFSGMSDSDAQRFINEAPYGNRPTWQHGPRQNHTRENLQDSVYRQFADYFSPNGQYRDSSASAPPPPLDRRARKALAVLDLDWPVSAQEIKLRYKTLVKMYHPDINKTAGAEERFKAVTEAYHQLSKALSVL
jgi:hypothetical protein